MSSDTITLGLDGDVSLADFSRSMENLAGLVADLTEEIGKDADVDWAMDKLSPGSANVTVLGTCSQEGVVESIAHAYLTIGKALESGQAIPYSPQVCRRARAITGVLDGRITSVRFATRVDSAVVATPCAGETGTQRPVHSYGVVKGTVETLSRRQGPKFILYDALFDGPVQCHLAEGQEELARDAWGKRVVVSGEIRRNRVTGRLHSIRNIDDIRIVEPVEPGSYKRARGVLPLAEGAPPSEVVIRRLRDA